MREAYLLDTCVISELIKDRPDAGVQRWFSGQEDRSFFLSVLTLGELARGIAKLPRSVRRKKLGDWVSVDLAQQFEGRLLPIDEEVARTWGDLSGNAEARGRKLPVIDGLLAATAIVHGLHVVTRNMAHMEQAGVVAINPWSIE